MLQSIVCAIFVLSGTLIGCNPDEKGANNSDNTNSTTKSQQQTTQAEQRESAQLLDSILTTLDPENLGFSSQSDHAISLLRQWGRNNLNPDMADPFVSGGILPLLENTVPVESIVDARESQFLLRDAGHIRDCLLFHTISRHVTEGARDDVAAAVALFDYSMRNIALTEENELKAPLSIFEVLVRGRGSVPDRIWLFANLLRQQRIDAVLIIPKAEADSQARFYPLVGVLLAGEVYLFDPFLATPVPAASDVAPLAPKTTTDNSTEKGTALVERPATLKAVLEDDQLLRRLDFDPERPTPITAEKLKNIVVMVISDAGYWSQRMQTLEQSLTGDRSMVVSDVLYDYQLSIGNDDPVQEAGAISRIARFGKDYWPADNVRVWFYPEQSMFVASHPNEQQQKNRGIIFLPFQAPERVKSNPDGQGMRREEPERLQHKTRITQLLGDYPSAIARYSNIRLDCGRFRDMRVVQMTGADRDTIYMHEVAFDDALYWTGLCHMQAGDTLAAVSTFEQYMNPGRKSIATTWIATDVIHLALCHARLKDWPAAIARLKLLPPQSNAYPRAQFLIRRWSKAAGLGEETSQPDASNPDDNQPESAAPDAGPQEGPLIAPLPAEPAAEAPAAEADASKETQADKTTAGESNSQ